MAISKQKKVQLHSTYIDQLNAAGNVAIFSQSGLSVNESNNLRKLIKREGGLLQVTKKRLFVRAVSETDFGAVQLDDLNGAIWVVYTTPDNTFGPIKTVSQFIKDGKKDKKLFTIEFQGGWMKKEWLDSTMMTEVANLPSKEELIGKMMFLFKHPIQSFTSVLHQIAEKGSEGNEVESEKPKAEDATEVEKVEESTSEASNTETTEKESNKTTEDTTTETEATIEDVTSETIEDAITEELLPKTEKSETTSE